jgi:dipeptidyl aminopeptidase/acylaminoacyl peptidase
MRPGLTVRREWYRDGDPWIIREEEWDFEKYGDCGEVTDIFVIDEDGLEPGSYRLYLYIDGQPQFMSIPAVNWFVVESEYLAGPSTSPDGRRIAYVDTPGTLTLDEQGDLEHFSVPEQIRHLAWFPDSRHLVFTDVDDSNADDYLRTNLFLTLTVMNTETGETWTLNEPQEDTLSQPAVSPEGRYIAALTGTGFADAALVDRDLIIIVLDEDYRRVASYVMEDFEGAPTEPPAWPSPVEQKGVPLPGRWTGTATLRVGIGASQGAGIYVFDMDSLTATLAAPLIGRDY